MFTGVTPIESRLSDSKNMNEFDTNNEELLRLVDDWTPKLIVLSDDIITTKRNSQNK
jgi:hypothetical protein